jgi:GNAT superfamily N-acetyltransferase
MNLMYREAEEKDVISLVKMLADDEFGSKREDFSLPINEQYFDALKNISNDPNNELVVVENEMEVVGMLQLTVIPYLTHIGTWRCLIEGVRINSSNRGLGLGTEIFRWAIARAKERNCGIVPLTSDKLRPDALRFYEGLGFKSTHEGFKLKL